MSPLKTTESGPFKGDALEDFESTISDIPHLANGLALMFNLRVLSASTLLCQTPSYTDSLIAARSVMLLALVVNRQQGMPTRRRLKPCFQLFASQMLVLARRRFYPDGV